MKVGLFGGTFDPIHMGHLIVAESVRKNFQLDRILFIPSSESPHKLGEIFSSVKQRRKLLKLALKTNPHFKLCDVELQRGGVSYTLDTVLWFLNSKKWCRHNLFLIIGADSLLEIETWKNPDQIMESIQILVMSRPGADISTVDKKVMKKIIHIPVPLIDISSTDIRQRIRNGQSIGFHVPGNVEKFIIQKGMYQ